MIRPVSNLLIPATGRWDEPLIWHIDKKSIIAILVFDDMEDCWA